MLAGRQGANCPHHGIFSGLDGCNQGLQCLVLASFLTTTFQLFLQIQHQLMFFLRLGPHLRGRGPCLQKRLFFMERVPAAVRHQTQIAAEVKLQSAVWSLARRGPIEICILEESRETMRVGERGRPARSRNLARRRCGLSRKNPRMSWPSQSLSAAATEKEREEEEEESGHS